MCSVKGSFVSKRRERLWRNCRFLPFLIFSLPSLLFPPPYLASIENGMKKSGRMNWPLRNSFVPSPLTSRISLLLCSLYVTTGWRKFSNNYGFTIFHAYGTFKVIFFCGGGGVSEVRQ